VVNEQEVQGGKINPKKNPAVENRRGHQPRTIRRAAVTLSQMQPNATNGTMGRKRATTYCLKNILRKKEKGKY